MDRYDLIRQKLIKIDQNIDVLPKNQLEIINKIEFIIETKLLEKEKAIKNIQNNSLTLSKIASSLEISRTTIYNHKVLRDYIELSLKEYHMNSPYFEIDKLQKKVKQQNENLEYLYERDISIEIMKHQNQILLERIESLEKSNQKLLIRNRELSQKINKT